MTNHAGNEDYRRSHCLLGTTVVLFVLVPQGLFAMGSFRQQLPTSAEIASSDWNVRRDAFARLIGVNPETYASLGNPRVADELRSTLEEEPATAEDRKMALIDLLQHENAVADEQVSQFGASAPPPQSGARLSEQYGNYYGDVIAAVSSQKDVRALDALLGAIATGSMAVNALASFGEVAVEPVVRVLTNSDDRIRSSATLTLVRMLEVSPQVLDADGPRAAIEGAFGRAASDDSPFVRIRAVQGLAQLGDPESLAIVRTIAENDPYQADYRDGRPYIVREAALEALRSRGPR